MDAAELPPGATTTTQERVAQRRAEFEQVPADVYPRTRAATATMAAYITDTQFRSGLNSLIAGLGPVSDER